MTNSGTVFPGNQVQIPTSLLILAAATLLVYLVSFFNGFVVDDEFIIVKNPQTFSLRNIPDVLLAPDLIKPYYRPLNRATYLLDYRLAGMNPAWYHGVNVLIHLGNVILLYMACLRLLPDRTAALVAALIFAVHPANSEAVNFVSARNTLLSLFFSLASLLAFMDARKKGKRFSVLSGLLFFFGLLSKETAFMLIVVITLYTFVPLSGQEERKPWHGQILFLFTYILAAMFYFVMRYYSLQGFVGTDIPANGLVSRLAQNYHVIPQYLGLLLFPLDLTLFHEVPQGGLFKPPWFLPAWLLLLAVVGLVIRSRNGAALFGLAWLVINYAPISNIVPIPSDRIAERFIYLQAVGFFVILGVLFSWFYSSRISKKVLWGVVSVVVVTCVALTVKRNTEWRNDLTLFSSGVKNNPLSTQAHYNLGTAMRDRGDLSYAKREWEMVLDIDPAHSDSLTQMGTLAAMQGDLKTAEKYYISALIAPPGNADPDKAMVHYNLGKIYEKLRENQQAILHFDLFLKLVSQYYGEYIPDAEYRLARLRGFYNQSAK